MELASRWHAEEKTMSSQDGRDPGAKGRTGLPAAVAVLALTVGGVAGCDVLDVELPTRVPAEVIDDPAIAKTIVLGVQMEFECFFSNYVAGSGDFTDELFASTNFFGYNQFDLRQLESDSYQNDSCVSQNGFAIHRPMHTARFVADDAVKRLEGFDDGEVPDKASLMATALTYGGYVLTLMGEGYCMGVASDLGPPLNPSEVLQEAENRFNQAINLAETSGPQDILLMALMGRARVRLDLGDKSAAASDAKRIPEGFRKDATYSTANDLRENQVNVDVYRNNYVSVEPFFWNLEVDGVPDPRVTVTDQGRSGLDGRTPLWFVDKYPTSDSPIRLASWEEAQLVIAEAELGQSAVDRINALRAKHGLPRYMPADVNDDQAILAQVLEERRRELFLEGHRLNDKRRHNLPFKQGRNHKDTGTFTADQTCFPLAQKEVDNNPNVSS